MEVGEVSGWFELGHIYFYLVDCMSPIDKQRNSLLGEELLKGFNWADDGWH